MIALLSKEGGNLKTLTDRALNLAQVQGATYADMRIARRQTQNITVKNGVVEALSDNESQGFGVRVVVDGAWGFASSALLTPDEVDRVTALAVQIARASALFKTHDVDLGPPVAHTGTYRTPTEDRSLGGLAGGKAGPAPQGQRGAARHAGRGCGHFAAWAFGGRTRSLPTREGAFLEQEIIESGGGIEATGRRPRERARCKSAPIPTPLAATSAREGWEAILALDLPGNAPRVGEEAVALLSADPCPSGVTTLILGPTQLALQVHESCGHPIELDRVFGTEASYAGTSFLTPEKYGAFRYGSEIVNMTADATIPGRAGHLWLG